MRGRWALGAIALVVVAASCAVDDPTESAATSTAVTEASTTTAAPVEPSGPTVRIEPGDDAALVVANAEAETTFVFASGVHRGVSVAPRDGDVFTAEPDAVLSGAVVVTGFEAVDGRWRATVEDTPNEPFGLCAPDRPACGLDEELFLDGRPIERVTDASALTADSWWFDPAGPAVVLGADPGERTVELSVTSWALRSPARDVTVRGLELRHYANQAGIGVVHVDEGGGGWSVQACRIIDSHGVGIVVRDGSTIEGCWVDGMGQQGIGAGGADLLIARNVLARNNRLGFDAAWSAGGAKFAFTDGLVVRENVVLANDGAGLWTDLDCVDTLYEDNWVQGNSGAGIFHEISYAATIRGNTVLDNGDGAPGWIWGAGIQVAGSADVTIERNIVRGNRHGIAGVDQQRGEGQFGEYRLRNLTVVDNVVADSGQVGIAQDHDFLEVYEAGHRFERNEYVGDTQFAWVGGVTGFDAWQQAGNDLDGSYREN